MKRIWLFFVILDLLLISMLITTESEALQQVAGPILVEIKPGETKTFQWGLGSDSDNITTVELRAEGEGAEFLSFPKTVSIEPRQLVYVEVTVTIPSDHPGDIQLNPAMYATEFGEKGGATVINIQMKKIVTIMISPNENPEFRKVEAQQPPVQPPTKEEERQNVTKLEEKEKGQTVIVPAQEAPKPGTGGGGCLIATAAFGSELAPQVQFLRNFRDNNIISTAAGSSFMNAFNMWYYSFSPSVANAEREVPVLQQAIKYAIYPLLGILTVAEKAYLIFDGEAGAVTAGLVTSSMIGFAYFWPIAYGIERVSRRRLGSNTLIYGVIISLIGIVAGIIISEPILLVITTSAFVLTILGISSIISVRLINRLISKVLLIFKKV